MDVEVEGGVDGGVSEEFADGLIVCAVLDKQPQTITQTVVILPVCPRLCAGLLSGDNKKIRLARMHAFQDGKQKRGYGNGADGMDRLGWGDDETGCPAVTMIDALYRPADADLPVLHVNISPLQGAQLPDAQPCLETDKQPCIFRGKIQVDMLGEDGLVCP